MKVNVSNELAFAIALVAILWLLTKFIFLPAARHSVTSARSTALVKAGARYGVTATASTLLDTMLIAAAAVLLGWLWFQWRLSVPVSSESALENVVRTRDQAELAL